MHQLEYCADKSVWNVPFICGGFALTGLLAITLVVGNGQHQKQRQINSSKFKEKIYLQHHQEHIGDR